jgi:shikimate kinase
VSRSLPSGGRGVGAAHGAITVLNGTATGVGCALAVQGGVRATWQWHDQPGMAWGGPGDDRVVRAVRDWVAARQDVPAGATVQTTSWVGPARGLKTSSAAAAALVQAALAALGHEVMQEELVRIALTISKRAGTTLTGALDDQLAVVLGGCRLADNGAGFDLGPLPVEPMHVAVWVADQPLDKARLRGLDLQPVVASARAAEALARRGDVAGALQTNGDAYAAFYQDAGLPISTAAVQAARDAGALAAGLSGTGPAIAALFARPVALPKVPGGAWLWTQSVTARGGA